MIGIDCGSAIVGWAIIERKGNKLEHLASGEVRTQAGDDMSLRLKKIHDELIDIIKTEVPMEMAIESLFHFKNAKTVISVSQARGVIMLCGAESGLPVYDYTPLQVKSAVTGYGRAEKKQVQFMVTKILGLRKIPEGDDQADAIAVGICHLNSR